MSERGTMPAPDPAQHPESRVGQDRPRVEQDSVEGRRKRNIQRLLSIFAIAAVASIAVDGAILAQKTTAWQMAVAAGAAGAALALVPLAYHWMRRGRLDASAMLLLFVATVVLAVNELVLADATLVIALAGVLIIVLVGQLTLSKRRPMWLVTAGLYIAYVVAINLFKPLPRYAVSQSPVTQVVVPGIALSIVVAIAVFSARAFRIGTLRARMLTALLIVALLPVIAIAVGLVVLGMRNEQMQVIDQLESVAILKEAEIDTWIDNLSSDLAMALTGDLASKQALVLLAQSANPAASTPHPTVSDNVLRTQFEEVIARGGRLQELFLLDLGGRIILSTDAEQQGQSRSNQAYFREGLRGAYVQPPAYSVTERQSYQFVSLPVVNEQGEVKGVLAGRASLAFLNEIMGERSGLGETGETYLVASNTLLTSNRAGEMGFYVSSHGIDRALEGQVSSAGLYSNYRQEPVVGAYRWLPQLGVALLAEQQRSEALGEVYMMLAALGGIGLVAVFLAAATAMILTRSIATPLANLATTATQIAEGNLQLDARIERADEIGALSRAFNAMTAQLRGFIGSLEQRVAERTRELQEHSSYLEAAANVARAASSILDADALIQQVVQQIRDQFDLYYVGLFLVDEGGQWAVLQANAGRTGRPLPVHGQRLALDHRSMVGWSIVNAQARIALEASEDEVRLPRFELPETRSEAALPLRSRGQVIGALTVQHDRPNAFDQDAITVLQTVADQVAVALDNARLFAERQAALEATQRAYGELSREDWAEILRARTDLAFRSDERGTTQARDTWRPEMKQALVMGQTMRGHGAGGDGKHTLAVPIQVRGQVVGVLDTYKPAEAGDWTGEEIALLEAIATQLDSALEGARLYQDTQRRAAREQAIRQVTEEMRRAVDVEAILQSTVTELAKALGAPRAYVRLGMAGEAAPDNGPDQRPT
jgi:GAF domain-containing protein/HAMP domain-containing protein